LSTLANPADHDFKAAVILDPWMYSVSDEPAPKIPMLSLQSEVNYLFTLVLSLAKESR
jgi:hypothetical protein